jgi:hypothetical protein
MCSFLLAALLAHGVEPLPELWELQRWPDRGYTVPLLRFQRDLITNFEKLADGSIDLDAKENYRCAALETERLRRAWDALDDALCDQRMVEWRRKRLADFKRLVGDEAFYSGRVPIAPTWRMWSYP